MAPLTIDIVSDVVCPWCYLGKRRLEAALQNLGETDAVVQWRPFQLDETIPEEGMDRQDYMRRKFGDLSRISEVHKRLESFGAEVGASYDFAAILRAPNTLRAHLLIRWAGEAGKQDQVADALFRAFFERGQDIGDAETLIEIAEGAGMDGEEIRGRLRLRDGAEATRREIDAWRRAGVTGVPFFILEGKVAVAGAQSVDALTSALIEARHRPAGGAS